MEERPECLPFTPVFNLGPIPQPRSRDSAGQWGWGVIATPALFGRGDPKSLPSWSRGLKQCLLWSTCLTPPFSFSHRTSKRSSFQQLLTPSFLGRKGTFGRFLYQVSGPEIRTEHPQCGPTPVLRAAAGDGSRDTSLVSPLLSSVGLWCRWRNRMDPWGPCEEISQVLGLGWGKRRCLLG